MRIPKHHAHVLKEIVDGAPYVWKWLHGNKEWVKTVVPSGGEFCIQPDVQYATGDGEPQYEGTGRALLGSRWITRPVQTLHSNRDYWMANPANPFEPMLMDYDDYVEDAEESSIHKALKAGLLHHTEHESVEHGLAMYLLNTGIMEGRDEKY